MGVMVWVIFFKQKTAYEMRISDWSSDVCSSDLRGSFPRPSRWPPCPHSELDHSRRLRSAAVARILAELALFWPAPFPPFRLYRESDIPGRSEERRVGTE